MTRWWRRLCPPESRWAGLGGGLEAEPPEWVFRKSRYSAFRGTRLNAWLKKRGIADLVVAGVMTHLCVEATVRDAFEAGYRVHVPLDGCAAGEKILHLGSLRSMACGFAYVRRGRDIDFSAKRRMEDA